MWLVIVRIPLHHYCNGVASPLSNNDEQWLTILNSLQIVELSDNPNNAFNVVLLSPAHFTSDFISTTLSIKHGFL